MKLPSLSYLAHNARTSFLRFQFTVIAGLVAASIGIYLNEQHERISNVFPYINVMLCAGMGISLFFCADVFAESKGYSKSRKLQVKLLAVLVLVALYFTLPDSDSTQNTSLPYIRYGIYSITMHLLVAFVPFLDKGKLNGFWHYNKILFVRVLTSALYSGFLFAGLALALWSLDFLFDIDLHDELFFDLFIIIAAFFNTWFFVSGIPENFNALDEETDYPKGIKIFSQYVLLSLLVLYLVILYIYATKIVITGSWPKGLVSYLIASVAVLGILTLLLIHPYGNLQGNSWIKKFSKAYYFILFPLVALLFVAIGMRVAEYGITINRYVILVLGVWLVIVCTYFSIGKTNIKFIPISLAVMLVAVSFGYWGMFSVSERSQVKRLTSILEQGKILHDGKVQQEVIWQKDSLPYFFPINKADVNEKLLNDSLHNEVLSILDYLDDHHGFASIRNWYQQDIDSMTRVTDTTKYNRGPVNEAQAYMRSLGLQYVHKYKNANTPHFSYNAKDMLIEVIDVRDYDYMVRLEMARFGDDEPTTFNVDKIPFTFHYSKLPKDNVFLISKDDTVIFKTDTLIASLLSKYDRDYKNDIPASEMLLLSSSSLYNFKLEVNHLSFTPSNDTLKIDNLKGNLFIKKK